jgi:hypothetical protein
VVDAEVDATVGARSARRQVGLLWREDRPLTAPAARFRDFVDTRR